MLISFYTFINWNVNYILSNQKVNLKSIVHKLKSKYQLIYSNLKSKFEINVFFFKSLYIYISYIVPLHIFIKDNVPLYNCSHTVQIVHRLFNNLITSRILMFFAITVNHVYILIVPLQLITITNKVNVLLFNLVNVFLFLCSWSNRH